MIFGLVYAFRLKSTLVVELFGECIWMDRPRSGREIVRWYPIRVRELT